MAQRVIVWTKTADIQFAGVLEYWTKRNNSNTYAKKLVALVTERTKQIAENPKIYKLADYEGVRTAAMGNFSIYYKTTSEQIIIFAFWDNRQDHKKLLATLRNTGSVKNN